MTVASGWMERWRTAQALGITNAARVLAYRGMKRTPLVKWLTAPPAETVGGDLFKAKLTLELASLEPDLTFYFSHHRKLMKGQVAWLYDPFTDATFETPERHWSEIPDFSEPGRDIKVIWELSRFDWLLKLALAARKGKREAPIARLNALVRDWQRYNPPFFGPNWKCGQETAIRMLQTLLAASLLQQDGLDSPEAPSEALKVFVEIHIKRIVATLQYAIAQDNNHSVSEAAGLYIAGAWLSRLDEMAKNPQIWHERGRRHLERLAARLFAEDGSFSQYSITYHRFVIDMLSQVEWWRQRLGLPRFSDRFYQRVQGGIRWLYDLTDPVTGDGPNVGSNDGARLFVLSETDYRDFRPSVQLAMKLFENQVPYPEGEHDQQLLNLGLSPEPRRTLSRLSRVMTDGGFVLMIPKQDSGRGRNGPPSKVEGSAWACVRFPSFSFRPSHADALHLDLWVDGVNLLRDSGSYSYNPAENEVPDLRATAAHNTIEFDGRDQMPRLGRFLFSNWLEASEVSELIENRSGLSWTGAYHDHEGCRHRRTILCEGEIWRIKDEISGQREKAVLRWRLAPGDWVLDGMTLTSEHAMIAIRTDQPPMRIRLVDGKESRYYLDLKNIPVLEVELKSDVQKIETTIILPST